LMACIRDARGGACSLDVKEAPACVSAGPPVSIEAEAQTVPRHNHRISRIDYRQVRNALGKLLTCRRKPDGKNGPLGFNQASLPDLACVQLPACPKGCTTSDSDPFQPRPRAFKFIIEDVYSAEIKHVLVTSRYSLRAASGRRTNLCDDDPGKSLPRGLKL
jgi:hypothetical protein